MSPTYRQANRQRVATAAAMYFARFPRNGWRFVGSEVNCGSVRLDLVWERNGSFEADEVKTGLTTPLVWARLVWLQVEEQWWAGLDHFGPTFERVRAVMLSVPQQSFSFPPGPDDRICLGRPR